MGAYFSETIREFVTEATPKLRLLRYLMPIDISKLFSGEEGIRTLGEITPTLA